MKVLQPSRDTMEFQYSNLKINPNSLTEASVLCLYAPPRVLVFYVFFPGGFSPGARLPKGGEEGGSLRSNGARHPRAKERGSGLRFLRIWTPWSSRALHFSS